MTVYEPLATEPGTPPARLAAMKILIVGGYGVGKTTLVGAISEIDPLTTEADVTQASIGHDRTAGTEAKATTTVALDFGRITLRAHGLQLLLFGAPGQQRFWFMWDDLATGALGAVVLADTRRLEDSFPVIEYCEQRGLPFIVAVNEFDPHLRYPADEVRAALALAETVPIQMCDARKPASVQAVLIALAEHAVALYYAQRALSQ